MATIHIDSEQDINSKSYINFDYYIKEKGFVDGRHNDKSHYFFFVLKGVLSVSYNEYATHTFEAGSFGFVPRSSYCSVLALEDVEYILLKYDLSMLKCNNIDFNINTLSKYRKYEFKSLQIRRPLEIFLHSMIGYIENGVISSNLLNTKLEELFLIFQMYYSSDELEFLLYQTSISSTTFRSKVLDNYMNVKTAEELANILGYGETAFLNMFKKNFGVSPYRWMQQQKAKQIHIELLDVEIPLKEIAAKYNFTSPAHFNTYCKKYFNSTPGNIRAKIIGGGEKNSISIFIGEQ